MTWIYRGWWLITLILLAYFSRTFLGNGVFLGHDSIAHLTRSEAYVSAWSQGQFPVRYIGWVFDGAGTPFFNIYPVGFYLVVAGLTHLGLPITTAFQAVVWTAWIGAGGGIFWLMRRLGFFPAWTAAFFWWLSPYAAAELFLRTAYPELMAICFGVISLATLDDWLHEGRFWAGLLAALCWALVLITHPPTAVILTPVLAGYSLWFYSRQIRWREGVGLIILTVGLAAFYLVPALVELPLIHADELKGGYYDYQYHFLAYWQLFSGSWHYGYSNPGTADDMPFMQTPVQWLVVGISLVIWGWFRAKKKLPPITKRLGFWTLTTLIAYGLSLEVARPLWERVPVIQYIQYPWRTFMVGTIGMAVLAGLLLSLLPRLWQKALASVVMVIVLGGVTLPWFQPFQRISLSTYPPEKFRTQVSPYPEIGIEVAYIPMTGRRSKVKGLPLWQPQNTSVTITPQTATSSLLTAQVTTATATQVTVKRWYYPGWVATVDNVPTAIALDQETGLISLSIPAGVHEVTLAYQGTRLEQASNTITLVSIGIYLSLLLPALAKVCRKATASSPVGSP